MSTPNNLPEEPREIDLTSDIQRNNEEASYDRRCGTPWWLKAMAGVAVGGAGFIAGSYLQQSQESSLHTMHGYIICGTTDPVAAVEAVGAYGETLDVAWHTKPKQHYLANYSLRIARNEPYRLIVTCATDDRGAVLDSRTFVAPNVTDAIYSCYGEPGPRPHIPEYPDGCIATSNN